MTHTHARARTHAHTHTHTQTHTHTCFEHTCGCMRVDDWPVVSTELSELSFLAIWLLSTHLKLIGGREDVQFAISPNTSVCYYLNRSTYPQSGRDDFQRVNKSVDFLHFQLQVWAERRGGTRNLRFIEIFR